MALICFCSCGRARVSPVLQLEQLQDEVHPRVLPLHGHFCSPVLQSILLHLGLRPCSYPFYSRMFINQPSTFALVFCWRGLSQGLFWLLDHCLCSSTTLCRWYSRLQRLLPSSWLCFWIEPTALGMALSGGTAVDTGGLSSVLSTVTSGARSSTHCLTISAGSSHHFNGK